MPIDRSGSKAAPRPDPIAETSRSRLNAPARTGEPTSVNGPLRSRARIGAPISARGSIRSLG